MTKIIKANKPTSAFTIVELLIVIIIIGILAAITIVSYQGITKRAGEASLQSDLANASKKSSYTKPITASIRLGLTSITA